MNAEIQAQFEAYNQNLLKEGERRVLLLQLRSRFGDLPPSAIARIDAADLPDLAEWSVRILTAQTLAEVLA